jgi:ADP-dependent NAD(P)H-hydrate dehydratase
MTHPLIDREWLRDHPLPPIEDGCDKNGRGRALVVGGAAFVPGALLLTGEAVLRAGAGKVQLATVDGVANLIGVRMPEASVLSLPADGQGEIAAEASALLMEPIERCDALVLGPGMSATGQTDELVRQLLASPRKDLSIVLDAAALTSARCHADAVRAHERRVVMTPHPGEMATLADVGIAEIGEDPAGTALRMARRFEAVILLKGEESFIADPSGRVLHFNGGCVGLATAGSGDVLTGIIGGLLARGAEPVTAAAWGCWLHGQAGRLLSDRIGHVGFLARELCPIVPGLLVGA